MELKTCICCKKELPISSFGKCSNYRSGIHNKCKECINTYYNRRRNGMIAKDTRYLEPFTDTQLLDELKRRGYKATFVKIINI